MKTKDQQNLIKIVQRYGGEWIEPSPGIPVITGKRDGVTIDAGNGKIWVRFGTGLEKEVLNDYAPIGFDRHITIGHLRSQPTIWRVRELRQNYLVPASNNVKSHHEQHEFSDTVPHFDITWIHRKQVISATMFVADSVNFKVRVVGGLFPIPGGWAMADSTDGSIAHPDIDLSSYIPTTGALYASIETDSNGVLIVNTGDAAESPELLTFANVATVEAGNRLIGFVLLYENQEALLNQHIYLPGLFMPDYAVVETGYQINTADPDVVLDADKFGFWDAVDEVLHSITWANIKTTLKTYFDTLYAAIGHTHAITTRWEPLTNGDPSDPQLVFDGEGDVIMVEVEI